MATVGGGHRLGCSLLASGLLCLVPTAQASQQAVLIPVADVLESARQAEVKLDYEEAADLYLELIGRTDLSEAQRIEVNLRAGQVTRIMGRDAEARLYFNYVLLKQPDFRLPPDTPPRVANFFELVRQEVTATRDARAVAIARQPNPFATPPLVAEPPSTSTATETMSGAVPAAGSRAPEEFPWLMAVGLGTAGVGLAVAAVGGIFGALALDAEQRALATQVQTTRIERYDERDKLGLLANIEIGVGAVAIAGGVAVLAVHLLMGGE